VFTLHLGCFHWYNQNSLGCLTLEFSSNKLVQCFSLWPSVFVSGFIFWQVTGDPFSWIINSTSNCFVTFSFRIGISGRISFPHFHVLSHRYVQLKKVSGGSRSDSCIVGGVVCRKNLAHRAMPTRLTNPRILLLSCAIVYQRVEGRLMSLEPVMMQVTNSTTVGSLSNIEISGWHSETRNMEYQLYLPLVGVLIWIQAKGGVINLMISILYSFLFTEKDLHFICHHH
jgi:hypothetical protein